jgi:hypothetical protein
MYAVVGCNRCGNLWLLSDPDSAETAKCSRCGKRHRVRKLRRFHETDDREAARQARSALLARKGDADEAFADLDSVAEMERQLESAGVSDEEFLAGSGLDPDAVSEAAEAATAGSGSGSRSREQIVRDGIEEVSEPTADAVVEYAVEHGVPEEAARDLLDRLRQQGEVLERDRQLRLL